MWEPLSRGAFCRECKVPQRQSHRHPRRLKLNLWAVAKKMQQQRQQQQQRPRELPPWAHDKEAPPTSPPLARPSLPGTPSLEVLK